MLVLLHTRQARVLGYAIAFNVALTRRGIWNAALSCGSANHLRKFCLPFEMPRTAELPSTGVFLKGQRRLHAKRVL